MVRGPGRAAFVGGPHCVARYDPGMPDRPRLRRWIPGPRWIVAGIVAALVGAELYLSSRFDLIPERHAEAHDRFGFRLRPNEEHPGHGGAEEVTNGLGFRDRDWGTPEDRDVELRVAVLGNSVAYGIGVPVEEAWPRVLEGLLDERDVSARVMNFAVPGYVVEQMARVWEDHAASYRPDVLILSLGPYSIRPMRAARWLGRLPLSRWLDGLSLVHYLERKLGRPEPSIPGGISRAIRHDPSQPAVAELWEIAERRVAEVVASARANGTRVFVLSAPMLNDVLSPERSTRRWEEWAAAAGEGVGVLRSGPALRASMEELLAEMEDRDVDGHSVWNKRRSEEPLDLEHLSDNAFFREDPAHLTPAGHRALAAAICERLVGFEQVGSE